MLWNSHTIQFLCLGTLKQKFVMNIMIQCQDDLLEIVTLTSVGTAGQTGRGVPQIIRQELYNSVMHFIILDLFQQPYPARGICVAGPFLSQGP